jgi:hypothetical protein
MTTQRTLQYEIVAAALLLCQAGFVSGPLLASPFQAAKKNLKEQDKLLSGPPFSLEQIVGLLDVHPDRLSKAIQNRGLNFEATPENTQVLRKAGASDKLLDLILHHAPVKIVAKAPPSLPRVGNLVVKCSPAECNIGIDGTSRGSTINGTLEINDLPLKDVVVDFEKAGYVGQQKTVSVLSGTNVSSQAELDPSEATKAQFGAELLSMTVQALGGDAGLSATRSLFGAGAAVVWDKAGKRSDWTLDALVGVPNMALLELEGSNAKFWVALIGEKYKSGGDRTKLASLFGAPAADKNRAIGSGELDASLRAYRDFQVSALIARIQRGGFSLSANTSDQDAAGEFHLGAMGHGESYDLTLDSEKLPVRLKYSSEAKPGIGLECVYSGFKAAGKGRYPSATEIKLADAPHHGIEVKLDSVTLVEDLREKDFNGHYRPKK